MDAETHIKTADNLAELIEEREAEGGLSIEGRALLVAAERSFRKAGRQAAAESNNARRETVTGM